MPINNRSTEPGYLTKIAGELGTIILRRLQVLAGTTRRKAAIKYRREWLAIVRSNKAGIAEYRHVLLRRFIYIYACTVHVHMCVLIEYVLHGNTT